MKNIDSAEKTIPGNLGANSSDKSAQIENASETKSKNSPEDFDAIIIGAGMGGLTVASLLANDGYNVCLLEAAHVVGGCSSSFKRKGYIFESGATTLIGFDRHQPLRELESKLGINLPRTEIDPSMTVHIDGEKCIRFKDREQWIQEAGRVFGNPGGQRLFWERAFYVSDCVWKVSQRNKHFPPKSVSDWLKLIISNSPTDAPVLRYAFSSVSDIAKKDGVATEKFLRFLNEQLMITAQATSEKVPFLFGAAGLTYTNYSNYYVEGGLIEMVKVLQEFINRKGSQVFTKQRVVSVLKEPAEKSVISGKSKSQITGNYLVETQSGRLFRAPLIYSNIPIWNMKDITQGEIKSYFESESLKYDKAWGAFTMGIVTSDTYEDSISLHHQIHLSKPLINTDATSIFVSMSKRGDTNRAPAGERAMNISCHTETSPWFGFGEQYEQQKMETQNAILRILKEQLPGFAASEIKLAFSSTPITWQNWVYRKNGRVGGIPQHLNRSLLDWSPAETPFEGLFLCGDTVYPGQGIPGVTLSGINVYYRSKKIRERIVKK